MRYTVFDVETPNRANDRMSAIGIVVIEDDCITEEFYSLVNPEVPFEAFNVELTGITPEMAAEAPTFAQLWPRIRPYLENAVLVAHSAQFDMAVLSKCLRHYGVSWKETAQYLCTCTMSCHCLPQLVNHKLNTLCEYYRISLNHHRADSDARACAQILLQLSQMRERQSFVRQYNLLAGRTIASGKAHRYGRV